MSIINIKDVKDDNFVLSKDLDVEQFDLNNMCTEDNRIIIDYLTFVSKSDTKETLIKFLGLEDRTFIRTKGWYGYSQQLYYDGIHILYDGTLEMGVCVEMSGQGCRNFEKWGTGDYEEIFSYILCNSDVNITRLDVAYDDFKGILDFETLVRDIEEENYVSRFREFPVERIYSKDISKRSFTIYCGSRSSEIMFRIYDKRAEQKAFDLSHWVRFEIQLRRDRADLFIKAFMQDEQIGLPSLFAGVVKNYLRFIVRSTNDTNLSRAKTAPYWNDFLGEVEKVSLFVADLDYSESNLERFVKVQCSSAVVSFIALFGFNNFIDFVLSRSTVKINDKHLTLLFNHDIYDLREKLQSDILNYSRNGE